MSGQLIQPHQLIQNLPQNGLVYVAGGPAEPRALTRSLQARPDEVAASGLSFIVGRIPGTQSPTLGSLGPVEHTSFFATPDLRPVAEAGLLRFVPMQYRQIWDLLRSRASVRAVLFQVAPADESGRHSLGLSADFVPALLARDDVVAIAEVNERLPSLPGAPKVPGNRIQFRLDSDEELATLPDSGGASETVEKIAGLVASLVEDGDCLETGVGAIPDAVLAALVDRRDLGFHSGMLSDGVMSLASSGALSGARKRIDTGELLTGLVLGSPALYDWCRQRGDVSLRDVSYTHDVRVLAIHDHFTAINSAIEVDLFGQVNSEVVRGRQISGTGGAVDFMRGAALSRGGKSIIALESTAGGGRFSRIVARLPAQHIATGLRTDAHYFVTEHGVADVRDLDLDARVEALLSIAHPDFRSDLETEWRETA